ncbi:MAG: trifunctional transcriptional regulator/proline dehydrogenase/L-glutamate gamma-semialdehyde, partial [Pseudomonadota bacterium]
MSHVSPGTDQRDGASPALELSLRDRARSLIYAPEAACVLPLIEEARLTAKDRSAIVSSARKLVKTVRTKRRRAAGLDTLMREFSLSSREGIALMRLAEAVLRVPDKTTLDALIRDKVGAADWGAHMGVDSPWFVNATAWGLMISGRVTQGAQPETDRGVLARLVAKGGEPFVRKGVEFAVRLLAERFVSGATIEDALWRAADSSAQGYTHSFDMLGESAINEEQVRRHLTDYVRAIHAVGAADDRRGPYAGNGISVKLSALYPRFEDAHRERAISALMPRLRTLASLARRYDIGFNIDAEDCDSLDMSVDILEALAFDPDLADWHGLGCVVQAYQKRARPLIDHLIEVAKASGHRLMIRLVKGAYWDTEIKRAQVQGFCDYPVFTRKAHTDVSYLACARRLLAARDVVFPQFATHNALTAATIHRLAGSQFSLGDWEFQCLHGMGEALYNEVLGRNNWARPVRIYCPVGNHARLLPYLVRRILENGANSSFVSQLVDQNLALDSLLADPVEEASNNQGARHDRIPLPVELFRPERANSRGADFGESRELERARQALFRAAASQSEAGPILAEDLPPSGLEERWSVINPADHEDEVGEVIEASDKAIEAAWSAATQESSWRDQSASHRATVMHRMADLIEANRDDLIALCLREAGKTLNNALGEVREAADFCRYYACRATELPLVAEPLGVVVCISPWNFPLAIFVGQVAAALVTGNRVLAKPAEQTSLIAAEATRLFHEAGVPRGALQLLPGRGEVVGAALIKDPRVDGVMFTGSTEVAQGIHRELVTHPKPVRLIAETGGINAMIVDSTALPNQAVEDVLASAFDSAGQRCSSLRVLCVQRDIADELLIMLRGAMRERVMGEGMLRTTDVGPVIDATAAQRIVSYLERMRGRGFEVGSVSLNADCARGQFVPPTLVEITRLGDIEGEVFGPVLHVLRYDADQLSELVEEINALGFGLTLGVHSRIDATVIRIVRSARVG